MRELFREDASRFKADKFALKGRPIKVTIDGVKACGADGVGGGKCF